MNTYRTVKGALLTTAIAAVAIVAQPALAQKKDEAPAPAPAPVEETTATVSEATVFDPLGGRIRTFGGRIRTFEGQVDSMAGRIRTFAGDLSPYVGRIRTFEGDVDAMAGRIRTFEGDIDPFAGRIRTFWGDLTPEGGELDPKVGRIRTFSDDFLVQATDVLAAWEGGDQAALDAAMLQLIADGETQWGAEITAQTGQSFDEAFAEAFFAKWELDPNNLSDLQNWDAWTRQAFLLDWYDNLLNYSGMDQVDHWMNAVNWTPALTQVQGGGSSTTIGVIDFFAMPDTDVASKTNWVGGYVGVNSSHGTGVGSLLVSSHDGVGAMGIAPNAKIAAWNPFDETYTASWEDVQAGIVGVGHAGASVVNLSLGVSGYTLPDDWRGLFTNAEVEQFRDNTVYVIAAGNDGITQTQDVEFGGALDTTFIVVGSVDPNGQISSFSNRPGEVCLLDNGKCKNANANLNGSFGNHERYLQEGGLLKNRFLVAPGEMILVSDGQGGVTRVSGTSFAAPLVTGAIALIHDRWPWLKDQPFDVAKAILESAQDLGAPGVDDVYGWGLLDIEASQSALDFNDLLYYLDDGSGDFTPQKINQLQKSGVQSIWEAEGMYFVAFEELVESDRDFLIPLSSRLFGSAINGQTMQEYMYHRFVNWLGGSNSPSGGGFTDFEQTPAVPLGDGWTYAMTGRLNTVSGNHFLMTPNLETTLSFNGPNNLFGIAIGHGDGSALIGGQSGFGLTTDYNPVTGGANPLLGFAAGGTHVAAKVKIADDLNLSMAVTNRDGSVSEDIAREEFGFEDRALLEDRGDYRASATTVRIEYDLSGASQFSLAVTMLDEEEALFGVRSIEPTDFGQGVRTTGVTLGADFDLGEGVSVFGAATASTSAASRDANLQVKGALSTAFQVGVAKQGLLGSNDRLRVTVAQPLTLERGYIESQMVGVIDRNTGEKGIITERFDIARTTQRRFVAEGHYAAPMLDGAAEVSLFARAELRPDANFNEENSDFLGGLKFRLAF